MKVMELIAKLEKMPMSTEVQVQVDIDNYDHVTGTRVESVEFISSLNEVYIYLE